LGPHAFSKSAKSFRKKETGSEPVEQEAVKGHTKLQYS